MNHQQNVHRALMTHGEMTSHQLANTLGLSYTTVRDACNRLLRKRVVAVVCVEDGHNIWASATKYLVEDGRGESEASKRGRALGTELMKERRREREQTAADSVQTLHNNRGFLRP